ncbi:MAG: MBL fold metallo-hydrolase [Dehalococcoidia bacterium]|nr:MAG: MBL fold metallo-hydrolase [Dehalococcoidia bacterium]
MQITTLSENTAGRAGLLAEWGLSILIEADDHRILLDTGSGFSAVYNAMALGVDLSRIDRIVFSHGHFDHTGGLIHILRMMRSHVEVIAHPDIWAPKYARRPEREGTYIGVPFAREAAEALGASFNLARDPVWINENIVSSGEIPMLTDYEKIDPTLYVKENEEFKPDPLWDDQAIFLKSEKGLIIILGCAHRGTINTIRYAQKLTGVEPVYAVIGGTHLISASPQRLDATITELSSLGVQRLGVSHCTGLPVSALLAQTFGATFFFNNAGTRITV